MVQCQLFELRKPAVGKSLPQEARHTGDYPLDALPKIIGPAVSEYQRYGQQPLPLITCSALSSVSLACQALANVARDRLLVSPVSMYFIAVASSGERKTASDCNFSSAIRTWQRKMQARYAPIMRDADSRHKSWRAEHDGLLAQIKKASLDGLDTAYLKEEFALLIEQEPDIPVVPRLFFEDVTPEALAHHLAFGWPSASLWSDEASIVLSGHGMQTGSTKFVAMLNRLWDAKDFIAHRKTSESFTIRNRRLTLSLMMQPLILQQMLSRDEGVSRQSGFLARCMICYPDSHMGKRLYKEPPKRSAAMKKFNDRIAACLEESSSLDKNGCSSLPTINFCRPAKDNWVKFFNEVERGLAKNDKWHSIPDFASKAGENVARLAGLFHLFSGSEGDISTEHTEQAIEIVSWHLQEVSRLFDGSSKSVAENDATKLQRYIKNKGLQATNYRQLRQSGPLREKARLTRAINELLVVRFLRESSKNGKSELLVAEASNGDR